MSLEKEVKDTLLKIPSYLKHLWWVDPGWMPGAHQSRSITLLLSWTGERRKYDERLVGRDKDRERSLTSYRHGKNRVDLRKN